MKSTGAASGRGGRRQNDFATLLGHCLPRGRREFVDIHPAFPAEGKRVISPDGSVTLFDRSDGRRTDLCR